MTSYESVIFAGNENITFDLNKSMEIRNFSLNAASRSVVERNC